VMSLGLISGWHMINSFLYLNDNALLLFDDLAYTPR
jgi:hypothetical protein